MKISVGHPILSMGSRGRADDHDLVVEVPEDRGPVNEFAGGVGNLRVLFLGQSGEFIKIRAVLCGLSRFHYLVDLATSLHSAIAAMRRKAYDVCLIDDRLGAQATLEFIASTQTVFEVPMILLTDEAGAEVSGPADTLVKTEITASLLDRSIRLALERRNSLGSMQESREFLRSALGALSSRIVILDEKGTILSMNEACARFRRENAADPAAWSPGQNYLECCDDAFRAGDSTAVVVAQGVRDVAEGRWTDFQLEYQVNSSGEPRWFALRVTRFLESGALRIVVAHDDITERKRTEGAMASSEKRFRALIENSSDITLLTNRAGEIVYASPAMTRILGYGPDEALGLKGIDLIHPADHENVMAIRDGASQLGDTAGLRMRARHKDGSWRWLEGTVTNYLEDPSVRSRVYNLQDCTERKQTEEELVRSEARFQHLADAGLIGVVEVDDQGALWSANDAFLKIVGRDREELASGTLNLWKITAPNCSEDSARRMATRHCEDSAEIRVADNGTGIPDSIRPRIFDRFFTTKEVGKGTGQGSAIVHDVIVHKHVGSVSVDSEVGKGTSFVIRLPLEGGV